jgi:hypothetical protein
MQSLSIFVLELQTAKRALLSNFELPDGGRRDQNATQGCRIVKNGRALTPNRAGALRFEVVLHG